MTGKYVDDNNNTGIEIFDNETVITANTSNPKPGMCDTFNFFCTKIRTVKTNNLALKQ